MKITKIEAFQIETPRYYGYISGHVVFKFHTDEGIVGLGEGSDSRAEDLGDLTRRFNELLVGRDPTRIIETNELMRAQNFASTVSNMHLAAAVDIALYDLKGKALGVPAHDLMGGKVRDSIFFTYPIFGDQVRENFEPAAGYVQRLVDMGHHLFRYYVSGDSALDDRFLTEMKSRHGDKVQLKSLDMSARFTDWEPALRYAEALQHHEPLHFEQPSRDMKVCSEFTRRLDAQVSIHIGSLEHGFEVIERGAGTILNIAWLCWGPTYARRVFALAEAAGFKALLSTDQDSTVGTAGAVHLGVTLKNLDIPGDPAGPLLYTVSPAKERIRAEASHLFPPEKPGLGVELDEAKLKELTIASA